MTLQRQAQVLGAQIPVPHASEGPLPSGSLDSPDTKKYIRRAEAMKKTGTSVSKQIAVMSRV